MEEAVWVDLHNQLEAQDALDGFEHFQAALCPEIADTIYRRYNINRPAAVAGSRDYTYNFPNSGLVYYDGDFNPENAVLWMTKSQPMEF